MWKTALNEGEKNACVLHVCMCVLDCTWQGKHVGESLIFVQLL